MTKTFTITVLAASILCGAATVSASPFLITVDTSPLSGPHTLVFGLTNFNSASNSVSLSAFDFHGGSAASGTDDCTFGGAFSGLGCGGDLSAGVGLDDLDPIAAIFTQQFFPGASLSFVLSASNNFSGGTPDQFALLLCDAGVSTCYSDDATGALLLLDFTGGTLTPSSFVLFGASPQSLAAPAVTAVPNTVPEPSTVLLLVSGLAGWWGRARRV
jgi:hypothetical protein